MPGRVPVTIIDEGTDQNGEMYFSLLDAVRMFIEHGIRSDDLQVDQLSPEHRIFKQILRKMEKNSLFWGPVVPDLDEFRLKLEKQIELPV